MPDRSTFPRLLTPAAVRAFDDADRSCATADHGWIREVVAVVCDMNASLAFSTSARTKSDVMADAAEGGIELRDTALKLAGHLGHPVSLADAEPPARSTPATLGGERARLDLACAALPGLLAALDGETDPARRAVICVRLARAGWVIFEAAEILAQMYWDLAATKGDDDE